VTPVAALTELAEAAYARSGPRSAHQKWPGMLGAITDPDRSQVMALAAHDCVRELSQAVSALSREPDLSVFLPVAGQFNPAIVYPGGSISQPFSEVVVSLLASAAQRHYYLRQEHNLESFTRAVMENYHQLGRLALGEAIGVYVLIGYTGIIMAENAQVETPWGVLKAAPPNFRVSLGPNASTAILAVPCTVDVISVGRELYPAQLQPEAVYTPYVELARQIVPMAFALATSEHARCAPMVTFNAALLPVAELNSFQSPETLLPIQPSIMPSEQELRSAESWIRRLNEHRSSSLQVAQRRLVSAITQRADKADSLIDAIIAWESLVGTGVETSFRVTAALAKLLEQEYPARNALRKRLGRLYRDRSKVVHGDHIDAAVVSSSSAEAIEIGLQALHALYERSAEWLTLKSEARADRLLLDD
jgi:hypothetical protein